MLAWWAPWLGPLVFAVGVYYHFIGPCGSLVWLCLTVYVATLGEHVANLLPGSSGYLGGFLGAASMHVVCSWVDRSPGAPAFQVLFLPAFWFLVPGVLADLLGKREHCRAAGLRPGGVHHCLVLDRRANRSHPIAWTALE